MFRIISKGADGDKGRGEPFGGGGMLGDQKEQAKMPEIAKN